MRLAAACGCLVFLTACQGPQPQQVTFPPPRPPGVNRLLFAGDVMFSRAVRRAILTANDPALPFRKIAPLLSSADLTFVNLESPFSDVGPYHPDGLIFHAAPDMVAGLQLAGVDLVSTANNHARDCASHGVEFTLSWLREHQMAPVGSGESASITHAGVVLTRHGVRFGFLGYTYDQQNGNWHDIDPRIALADPAVMQEDVRDLLRRCDVVIVSMHHGIEYNLRPSAAQVSFAHAAIDAGASVVIGHHPHVVEPREVYRGREIYYSLGNFIFDQYQREQTQHGEIVALDFIGAFPAGSEVMPVRITPTGPELEPVTQ